MRRNINFRIPPPTWHHHPAVRTGSQLTLGERAADKLRNGMGSWGFVFSAIIFLIGWMLGNRLLIAAKREDQISSDLARHDYETNPEADRIVKEIRDLALEIHSHTVPKPVGGINSDVRPNPTS
jgi:hypothetical protein